MSMWQIQFLLASAGAPLLELPGHSLKVSTIDLACNWLPPHRLYGNLLLRQMGQVFFPSQELQHLLLLSISAFILLVGTQCVLSMILFSLESLAHYFWTEARLTCSRMSEIVKPLWNKYPAKLCSHALSLILPLWWTPNFLLSLGWDR